MSKKNQHVVPLGNGWAVKSAGADRATVITNKQSDAISAARDIAKANCTELIVHGRDGKIRERNSYGADSYPPKD
ncbi:MAG: hypothetical protein JWQ27_756 [Ferruginibacter sp.]|nr:hypothetical protein [Ferruginibacter sp.]